MNISRPFRVFRSAGFSAGVVLILVMVFSGRGLAQTGPFVPKREPVRITSPANHQVFFTPVDIPVFAYVDFPGALPGTPQFEVVTNVEFYAGTIDLGPGINLGLGSYPRPPIFANFQISTPISRLGQVYCRVWTNAPAGAYALTAVAKVLEGPSVLSRTSAPVNITVLVPVTNPVPEDVVSIVATDPIAIASTNIWIWPGETNVTPDWADWAGAASKPPIFFTNLGPKDALFTVRRFGDVSSSLTVSYAISGIASNGVDYAPLPGAVTFPAGSAYSLIPIVPIDNSVSNLAKTVILTLTPSADMPPDYLIGLPRRAEALILERWLRPPPGFLPDATFHVTATGPDGAWFCVQHTVDLQNWTNVSTNQVFLGSIDFIDPDAGDDANGFYRAVPLDGPPAE